MAGGYTAGPELRRWLVAEPPAARLAQEGEHGGAWIRRARHLRVRQPGAAERRVVERVVALAAPAGRVHVGMRIGAVAGRQAVGAAAVAGAEIDGRVEVLRPQPHVRRQPVLRARLPPQLAERLEG